MAQVFSPRAGLLIKASSAAVVVIVGAAVMAWRSSIAMPHPQGDPVEQPVPFSHKHHVSDDGIDCRYCHATVETSAFAGMPPLSTCMTCHSQLYTNSPVLAPVVDSFRTGAPFRWQRVYTLPQFVYFDHSIHVNKGVGCSSCHGRVDRMPLTWKNEGLDMQWCLDCHRNPERVLRPPEAIFDMAWKPPPDQWRQGRQLLARYCIDKPRLIECSTCHR
jgi:hypothetical protein